jgi:outer membrane protein OmpA-like peptidoglycan-associated protein
VLSAASAGQTPTSTAPRVPFITGLTVVRATSEPRGDYENLLTVTAISPAGSALAASGEIPADDGSGLTEVNIVRRVRAEDRRSARKIRSLFHTGDPEQFNGTVPGLSQVILSDLHKAGRAQVAFQRIGVFAGFTRVQRTLSGTLVRVDGPPATMPMLVNGRRVALPVVHARGRLGDSSGSEEFEYFILDNPENPIILRSRGPQFSTAVIKIEYPEPRQVTSPMETELSAHEVAAVYGIYFSFARANIRPQSERVLKEIAGVLAQHPDWKLRISGHTDGIGDAASNLDLSRRRSAAVKDALVGRYHIANTRLVTDGFGESQPKASNDRPEGRALNRRVELTRL